MAEDLIRVTPDDEGSEPERPTSPYPSEHSDDREPPYQSRFQLLFGVLLGVAMAAVVATVIVLAGGRKAEDPGSVSWAPWRPTASDGLEAVNQIADHVGARYTLPSGDQLAPSQRAMWFAGTPPADVKLPPA